jgi:hypothetical protein
MSDFDAAVERYLAMWNEADPAARRALVDKACTSDVTYVDPLAAVEGPDALDGLIAAAQGQFAGFVFTAGGAVDGHHEVARFTWHLGRPGEEPLVEGFDVIELAADGRIRTVRGFLDKVPAA